LNTKLLFLDIDGVLNRHDRHANGVCGLHPECVRELNRILDAVPDLQLVIISAWRYYIHDGFMNHDGFVMMLQTHGVACYGRIHGYTRRDTRAWKSHNPTPEEIEEWNIYGIEERGEQIHEYIAALPEIVGQARFAIIDDLPLSWHCLFQTNKSVGLTPAIADRVIEHFGESQ